MKSKDGLNYLKEVGKKLSGVELLFHNFLIEEVEKQFKQKNKSKKKDGR